MSILKEYKELQKKYNAITTDWDRLQFLKDHKGKIKAILDNDNTTVHFIAPDELEQEEKELIELLSLNEFDDYHYYNDGCVLLFKFAGIDAEAC